MSSLNAFFHEFIAGLKKNSKIHNALASSKRRKIIEALGISSDEYTIKKQK